MKQVSLDALKNEIIKPGIDKHLVPLCLYKGNQSLGRVHQMWNHVIAMQLSEAETISEGVKLSHNPDFSQLCGTPNPLVFHQLTSILRRMRDNENVTNNVPGLTEYVHSLLPNSFTLQKISLESYDRNCAAYRVYVRKPHKPRVAKPYEPKSADLFYPYLIHEPKQKTDAHELLLMVNQAVPKGLPEQIRADLCQDLLVALLSGEIKQEELKDNINSYKSRIFKMAPSKWNHVSLDAPMHGTEDFTIMDTLQDDSPSEDEILERLDRERPRSVNSLKDIHQLYG